MAVHTAMGSALYSTLAAGTALVAKLGGTEIYQALVAQGTEVPYVVFQQIGGGDDQTSPRRARSVVFSVKAVSSALLEAAEIDDLVDALLNQVTLTVSGWGNYWTARESDVGPYAQLVDGTEYWHVGANYRIRIAEP